ncbi:aldose epimerase family protein [Pelagicoccus mobilis]|uniref:Aldose 1-epimerase n=1 Tax=Pelagicoccus mobilis TaxID=415221 RepID=A0A934RU36_9BACT|nr:aldose epimerase family protein [Pelagicoccus mobilis]MBK1877630.1 galactose mutarotase [Pelagicoccus mobilis]
MPKPRSRKYLRKLAPILASSSAITAGSIQEEPWGTVEDKPVYLYTLTNENGMIMKITNFGGIITELHFPDRNGKLDDVVLGFDNLGDYVKPHPSFGATIGRFANRIVNGEFTIDGTTYQLTKNNGKHSIHGGGEFHKSVWASEPVTSDEGVGVRLRHFSPDGSNGYPGNLDSTVTYTLTHDNSVRVDFEATTDKPTHVAMTQHTYFNLNGAKDLIYDQLLQVDATFVTEMDEDGAPTGVISKTEGKPWDLKEQVRIGDKIHDIPLVGYHHCYILDKPVGEFAKVATLIDPLSGRQLDVSTTQRGLVVYASNGLSDEFVGKYGIRYGVHKAICLETHALPASPDYSHFPSTVLYPEDKYHETVIYSFGLSE